MKEKIDKIKAACLSAESTNPVEIAKKLMAMPEIAMHGPEHHILDGAAFLTAMHNAGITFDLEAALDELAERGKKIPGAICGQWGVCGSAASVGAALAVIHGTGPLSDNEYYKDNMRLVSRVLGRIAEIGGPRCCKRNGFIALATAAEFASERYAAALEWENSGCDYSEKNKQCLHEKCPFYKGGC